MAPVNCDPCREIFLLCEYPTLNGGERSMLATLDGLRAAGFAPAVMAPPDGPLADALGGRGVETLPFQCRAADGTRLPQGRLREELAEVLRRRRPALLHANSLAMGRLSGPVAAELQLPSIAHLRDIVKLSAQAVADLNCHARLLAVSQATRSVPRGRRDRGREDPRTLQRRRSRRVPAPAADGLPSPRTRHSRPTHN